MTDPTPHDPDTWTMESAASAAVSGVVIDIAATGALAKHNDRDETHQVVFLDLGLARGDIVRYCLLVDDVGRFTDRLRHAATVATPDGTGRPPPPMTRPARVRIPAELVSMVTEAELQRLVVDAATFGGWTVAHFGHARAADGWRTPARYDAAGFPDLVLVRDRVLFLELKSARGRLSAAQNKWIAALGAAGADARVIRPADLDAIVDELLEPPGRGGS
jgi:hypothetical protein